MKATLVFSAHNKSNPHSVRATTSGLHSGGHGGTKQNTADYLDKSEHSVSTIHVTFTAIRIGSGTQILRDVLHIEGPSPL